MRQFIEDAEKDSVKETGTGASELNVKDTRNAKDTKSDFRNDVSCQEGPRTLDKDAIKALRMLLDDFENQLQYQNEVLDDSASEEGQDDEPLQEVPRFSKDGGFLNA